MRRYGADPGELEGDALDRWYRRTPDELEAERSLAAQVEYDAFFGGGGVTPQSDLRRDVPGSWQEARIRVAPARPLQPPRAVDASPEVQRPSGQTSGRFFDGATRVPGGVQGPDVYIGPAYPLNEVVPMWNGRFQLGDGSVVDGRELDRLYTEQVMRLSGSDEPEPTGRVRVVNRLQDGHIPQANQVAKGERELDGTCHPNGGWEVDPQFPRYAQHTRDYEEQITRAPGLDYVVRNPGEGAVKFDGCAVWTPRHELLEAKGPGIAPLLTRALRYRFGRSMEDKRDNQARRQAKAAHGRPVDVHVAEQGAFPFFEDSRSSPAPNVMLTPPR